MNNKTSLLYFVAVFNLITIWILVSKSQSTNDKIFDNLNDRELYNTDSTKHALSNTSDAHPIPTDYADKQLPRDKKFSKLDLFISAFPGGFGELKETFARTYNFLTAIILYCCCLLSFI